MFIRTKALIPEELRAAIVREPLVVSPDTTVMDAIAQMSGMRSLCNSTKTADSQLDELHLEARSSCVLVVENEQLVGILTERDIVRLSAQQQPLDYLMMRQVMAHPIVTLRESALTDCFFVINLFQQHHIRHLPILDERDRLVGLVTHESLRQTSQLIDLLRLRLVAEVMTREVICAAPDTSMLAIAQQMANHRVSSVMIVQGGDSSTEPLQISVGIVTERDLVQFQALGLTLETCTALAVMSTPIFAVKPQDSLWTVQQIMNQRSIGRLAVTGEQGELLGIVTQTSLLQAINPLDLYNLAEILEAKVLKLEAEKVALLENRNLELERLVEARTAALNMKAQREKLVADLAMQIRSSLSLQTILDTTVEKVRQVLECDRVNIWQFEADWQSVAVAESTDSSLSLVGERIDDTCFKENHAEVYRQGRSRVVPDIFTIAMSDCHRDFLIHLQTRAKIVVPILCGDRLWGLLNATESQHPRDWRTEEVELLQMLSVHIAIALQQATTHQQLQDELVKRQRIEATLLESEQRYATLAAAAPVGIFRTDAAGLCTYINDRYFQIAGFTPETNLGNEWQQALHPDDRDWVIAKWEQYIQEEEPFQLEYRFQRPDGVVTWVYGQSVAEWDTNGQVVGYLGTVTDITDRKQAETHLQESEERYATLVEASPVGIFRTDAAGNCIYVNDRWCQISGLTPKTAAREGWRQGLHPEDRDSIATEWQQSIEENRPFQLEYRFQRPDGTVTWVYGQSVGELDGDGQIVGYVGTVTDISDRKRSEEALQQSEAQSRALITAIPDLMMRIDRAGIYLEFVTTSSSFYVLVGNLSEMVGSHVSASLPPDLAQKRMDFIQLALQKNSIQIYEHELCIDGRKQIEEVRVVPYSKDEVLALVRDISDRKLAEAALIQSEAQSRAILAAIPDFMFRMGADGIYRECVTTNGEIDFLAADFDVAGLAMVDVIPPEIANRHLHYLQQALHTGELQVYEQQVQIGDRFQDEEVRVVKSGEDEVLFMIRDISDRKQAARQLHQLNQELEAKVKERTQELSQVNSLQHAILNGADYSIISTDLTGIIETFNAAAEGMLGYSATEMVGIATPALIHDAREVIDRAASLSAELGQDVPPGFEVLVAKARQGLVSEEEWSYIRKDGSRFPVLLSVTPLKDVNQQIMGFLGIAKDITDRKRAEAELQKLSDRLALSLKSGAIGAWEWDIKQNTIVGDERIYELFGFTKQSDSPIAYDSWANGLHPDDRISTETLLHQAVLGQAEYNTEYRFVHPDGSIRFLKANGVVVRDAQGNPQSMIGLNFDISDRKQAEAERQQLIQELSAFKLALDHSAIVAITDAQGVINYANDRFCDISGYSRDELIGQTHRIVNSGYHPPAFFQDLWHTIASGQIWRGEICNRTKNGSLYWLASTIVPFLDEQRRPFQYLAIRFDITARKLAQATVQQENTFRQQIVENMAEGLCVFHEVEEFPFVHFTVWNRQMQAITGYTKEEINRLGWYQSVYPDPRDREQAIACLGQIRQGENPIAQEREIQRQDGQKRNIAISTSVLSSNEGLTYSLVLIQDITDRKKNEQAMTQQAAAIEAAIDGIAIMQGDTYLYLNQAHLELFGYEYPEELVGKNWRGLYSLEELERFEQEVFPVLGRDRAWEGEAIATRKDGSIFTEGLSLTLTEDGLLICVCRDITDRKEAELRLQQQAKQERLLGAITQRMRSSLNLDEVLNTTVEEIRQVLQSDRALVYQVFPDGTGAAIAESVLPKWPKILDIVFPQEVFPEQNYERYIQGRVYALSDREDENQPVLPCLIQFLAEIHVRAKLVVPIVQNHTLWGLLIIHQCDLPRQWEDWEINLLKQTANQLAIAIQQANLYEQVQSELVIRKQTEEAIALQLERQRTLGAIVQQIRESLDINQILATVTQQVKEILGGDRVIVFRLFGNGRSQIVKESVSSQFPALKDRQWDNEVWSQEILEYYWQGKPRIVPDVMTDIWTNCLVKYGIEGQIQSKIVAPILQEVRVGETHRWVAPRETNKLWGVLVIHSCREKRVWQESEAELLQQIANQLAIAIQQASLFEQLQQELTERQQAEQQLTERNQQLAVSNEELARATRLKDEFLANMSHELRTPLNAILGMTEGLQEAVFGIVNEPQIKALQTIERSGSHLLELINDILDVAKIESGQMELDFTAVSINHLCQSSLAFIKQIALKKRIQIEIKIPLNLPELLIDERRIRQVLINLLNNAVKFTPEGGRITLEVTRQKRATVLVPHELALKPQEEGLELKDYLRIAVIDTGIGIAPENINKLFQPFIQIDSALNRQYAGTGLGLALVKRIVELHGGQVGLTSQVGLGSCFTIDLPGIIFESSSPKLSASNLSASNLKSQAESPIESPQPEEEASPLILLAEDNEANISTVTSYLKAKGYRIVLAKNGEEAIALAKSENPNLILMDIQMPGMDGLEAMQHIRRDPNLVNVPIIALTALAMTSDRDRCLAAGANDYLTKPVKLRQLATTIQQLLAL